MSAKAIQNRFFEQLEKELIKRGIVRKGDLTYNKKKHPHYLNFELKVRNCRISMVFLPDDGVARVEFDINPRDIEKSNKTFIFLSRRKGDIDDFFGKEGKVLNWYNCKQETRAYINYSWCVWDYTGCLICNLKNDSDWPMVNEWFCRNFLLFKTAFKVPIHDLGLQSGEIELTTEEMKKCCNEGISRDEYLKLTKRKWPGRQIVK